MAQILQTVQAGDLITADQMNRVITEINSLVNRVSALENSVVGGTAVTITDMIPPSGIIKVGDEFRVLGRNFGFSVGAHRVFIDNRRVDAFKVGSSDTQLVFDIPLTITDVPVQGRSAILTVANANSSAQRTLSLLPAQLLNGTVAVIPGLVTPATIVAGQAVEFAFELSARVNLSAAYVLSVTPNVAANQADWLANLRILDSNGNPLPGNQLTAPAGGLVPFRVSINPVPSNANGTQFSLTVNAAAGGVSGSTETAQQTVGQQAEQPDTAITMTFLPDNGLGTSSRVNPAGGGTITASEIRLNSGAGALVKFDVVFTVAVNHNLTVTLLPPANSPAGTPAAANWQVGPLVSTTPNPYPVSQQELGSGSVIKTLDFVVVRQANATSGRIEFKIQRPGVSESRRATMNLIAT